MIIRCSKHILIFVLRLFEISALREIFGPKRDKVTGDGRGLHNKELCDLYVLQILFRWWNKWRKMRWVGHVARMVARRGACRVLVGKPEGKRPLGRPCVRWEDNIKMNFREISWGTWTHLICLRIGRSDGLLRMRWWTFGFHKRRKFLISWGTVSFSTRTLVRGVG